MGLVRALFLVLIGSSLCAAPKAIWVWEPETARLLVDRTYETRVLSLLRSHGFTTLYLFADDERGRNPVLHEGPAYRALIGRMHAAGLRVEALLGSFQVEPGGRGRPQEARPAGDMVQAILDFNAAAAVVERFDGIHLDIEPYTADGWNDTTRSGLSRHFLTQSKAWVALARTARDFTIGAAIPFWYDGFEVDWEGRRQPMNRHVQGLYDYVAVMDYRNHAEGPDGIIAHAQRALACGAALGKPVVLGLETGEAEPAKVTFRHRGADALAREMAVTEHAFARQPTFAGFAIHHLRTWLHLIGQAEPPPVPPPPSQTRP